MEAATKPGMETIAEPVMEREARPLAAPRYIPRLSPFEIRLATAADKAQIKALMDLSIRRLQKAYLGPEQIMASFDVMGLDGLLIQDETYYVAERYGVIVGCGGWSRRATLYGPSASPLRDEALLDPAVDASPIRAMYTHPAHTRRGIGRMILEISEEAAWREGFRSAELLATLAGQPLYQSCGYRVVKEILLETPSGVPVPGRKMVKAL